MVDLWSSYEAAWMVLEVNNGKIQDYGLKTNILKFKTVMCLRDSKTLTLSLVTGTCLSLQNDITLCGAMSDGGVGG